jgi:PAS domain S-box-containing protein
MILKKMLGEIMVDMEIINQQQLTEALDRQKHLIDNQTLPMQMQRNKIVANSPKAPLHQDPPLLGNVLREMGLTTEEQLEKALVKQDQSIDLYNNLDKDKLGTAIEIGSMVNSSLDLAEVLHLIMNNANRVTNSVASTLMLLDETTGDLVFSVPTGPAAGQLTDIRIPSDKGIAGWVAKQGKPIRMSNPAQDERFYGEIDNLTGIKTESLLCVPLKSRSKLIGVIEAINKTDGTQFSTNDLLLLTIFGFQAAMAIENARLHSELKAHLDDHRELLDTLTENEEKYRMLVENANDAIFILQETTVHFPNPRALQMIGCNEQELTRIPFTEFIDPRDRDLVSNQYHSRLKDPDGSGTCSFQLINKEGLRLSVQLNNAAIKWEGRPATINFLRDVTEIKQLESRLFLAQKMEAIGTLSSGIAHDFNNILSAIMGFTELATLEAKEGGDCRKSLKMVMEACQRARNLVTQILSFSRQAEHKQKPIQIGSVVKEALKLLRASLPTTIEIRQSINPNAGSVEADPTKIHQVVMNLCTNAGQAMREKGGTLDVSLEPVDINAQEAEDSGDVKPGPYIRLQIKDTGCGIDKNTMKHIFEPYFTTKSINEGTGLGLAVVHGIVSGYQGSIRVQSETGKGACFDIYLPRLEHLPKNDVKDDSTSLPHGNETILFVDDELAIVEINKTLLSRLGYHVVTRTSSMEALELFKAQPDRFDLVLTDMTMPNLTGIDLSKSILKINPSMPIILCTGFSEGISDEKIKKIGIRELVMKPLLIKDIAHTLRHVLDAS